MAFAGWGHLRGVEYDKACDDAIRALGGLANQGPSRIDEVIAGVEWAVATAEDLRLFGHIDVNGQPIYVVKTIAVTGVPALRIFFTEKGGLVTMRFVEEDPATTLDDMLDDDGA